MLENTDAPVHKRSPVGSLPGGFQPNTKRDDEIFTFSNEIWVNIKGFSVFCQWTARSSCPKMRVRFPSMKSSSIGQFSFLKWKQSENWWKSDSNWNDSKFSIIHRLSVPVGGWLVPHLNKNWNVKMSSLFYFIGKVRTHSQVISFTCLASSSVFFTRCRMFDLCDQFCRHVVIFFFSSTASSRNVSRKRCPVGREATVTTRVWRTWTTTSLRRYWVSQHAGVLSRRTAGGARISNFIWSFS